MEIYNIIAFDFGTKYIGTAFGQSLTKTARPLRTINNKDPIQKWKEIKKLIEEYKPNKLLIGLPLNMDGSRQNLTDLCEKFGTELKNKFNLPTIFIDERLSTWEAKNRNNIHYKAEPKKKDLNKINSISAQILLEQWFSENHN